MMEMDKYFGAQGYVVFDIQYRIHDLEHLAYFGDRPCYGLERFNE